MLNTSTTKLQHYKKEEAEWPEVLSVVVLKPWESVCGSRSLWLMSLLASGRVTTRTSLPTGTRRGFSASDRAV